MTTIEKYGAPGVYNPPGYSHGMKEGEEFFGARGPASTMVEVKALAHPDYLIEVEAIAVV